MNQLCTLDLRNGIGTHTEGKLVLLDSLSAPLEPEFRNWGVEREAQDGESGRSISIDRIMPIRKCTLGGREFHQTDFWAIVHG